MKMNLASLQIWTQKLMIQKARSVPVKLAGGDELTCPTMHSHPRLQERLERKMMFHSLKRQLVWQPMMQQKHCPAILMIKF